MEGVGGAGQEAGDAHVRADDGDDGRVERADLRVREDAADELQAFFEARVLLRDEDGDRVGVRRLRDIADARIVHRFH